MKNLLTLHFGEKKIYNHIIYTRKIKKELSQGTTTLTIAKVENNKQKRNWHRTGVANVACRACESLMVIPSAYTLALRDKEYKCPNCGHVHKIANIKIAEYENSLLPYYIDVSLMAGKESVVLRLAYDGEVLGNNVYEDYKEVEKVKEVFRFLTNENRAVWEKSIEGKVEETREIGYYDDLISFEEKSALYWLNANHVSKEETTMCELLKMLRNEVNRRMKDKGLSSRKMYVNGNTKYKVIDNVLAVARQLRFWDSTACNNTYGKDRSMYLEWLNKYKVKENFDKQVEEFMKQGESYVNAMIKVYGLPNNRHVRKNLTAETAFLLHKAYRVPKFGKEIYEAICGIEMTKEKYERGYERYYNSVDRLTMFLSTFCEIYPKVPIQKMITFALSKNGEDTWHLWQHADKISREQFRRGLPRFKELHDYLSLLVAKQDDREIEYEIPEHIVRRVEMHLQNTNCILLQKYSEIKKASIDLKNCASSYKNRIDEHLQLVLMSDNNGKPVVLMEIKDNNIVQAKLFANKQVKCDEELNKAVVEFAEKAKLNITTNDVNLKGEEEETKILKIA